MKIFIYFILILSFIGITVLSNANAVGITEYETSTLFKDDGYEYKITYPVSEDNEWSIFYGATDSTIDKLEDGSILKTTAIITKQKPSFDGIIEIFVLKEKEYKNLFINKDNSFMFDISNLKNENFSKLEKNIENFYKNNTNNTYFSIIVDIKKNREIILFTFRGEMKEKKQTIKEFVKIISSLTREKINNQDDNAKQ